MTGGLTADYSDALHRGRDIGGVDPDLSTMIEPNPSTWTVGPWGEVEASELDYGAFTKLQLTMLSRVELTGGFHYDNFKRKQYDREAGAKSLLKDSVFTPSAGLAVNVVRNGRDAFTPYLSWGRGFAPAYRAVGSSRVVNVKPETSESYEAGLKGSWHGLFEGTCALYQLNRYDVVGKNPITRKRDNVGDRRIEGFEIGLTGRPLKQLALFGNYTIRTPEIRRDISAPANEGNVINGISRQMFTLGAEYQHPCGFGFGLDNHYYTGRHVDAANTIRVPAYNLLDIHIDGRWKKWRASLFVKNVCDKEYYSAIYNGVVNGNAFEGTPRTIGINVGVKF